MKDKGIPVTVKNKIVKAVIFQLVMYCYESWRKNESKKIDVFKLWIWRLQ